MTITYKHLGSGQLGSAKDTLYTANSGNTVKISRIVLTNTTTNQVEVSFWRSDGAERLVTTFKVPAGEGREVDVFALQGANLEETHYIAGVADTDAVINYQIDGKIITS